MSKRRLPSWAATWINAAKNWNEDGAFAHSASVSFYTLFSLAPITIIVLSIAGFFFGAEVANRQVTEQLSGLIGKGGAEMIQQTVEQAKPQSQGWTSTIVSIGMLIIGATTVFVQLQNALNDIWGVKTKPSRSGWLVLVMQRMISFAMVLTVGFLLLVSLILTTALASFAHYLEGIISIPEGVLQGVELLVTLGVITVLFAMMFKIMPDVQVRWKDIWRGALVTAVLFSVGRLLIALYLKYSDVASVYGAAGSLVGLLIWVYYSCAILFYGAELTRARCEQNGRRVKPKETAVLVREEIIETSPSSESA
ncbi:MAG: ribonuclease [Rariglobus sp.]|jgi:membrane protein|nr:ribonuclease [Rariglobus sp.]